MMTEIHVRKGDITQSTVDAIVNAANSMLAGGGGVDGAIHRAGGPIIAEQCREWIAAHGRLPTGDAMVTDGGDLPARFVIHTVGPVWGEHDADESRALLASCYTNSLEAASDHGCATVAFPNISTGVFGFPKKDAGEVAVSTVRGWIEEKRGIERITFVCFDDENLAIYSELLAS